MKAIKEQIKEARGKAGLTQTQLERALGISRQVNRWEHGKTCPTLATLERIAEVTGYAFVVGLSATSANRATIGGYDQVMVLTPIGSAGKK